MPALHLKYFGGYFWGRVGGIEMCIDTLHPGKFLDPPLKMISDHLGGRKHVPLFKIINLTRIMRTYELYY